MTARKLLLQFSLVLCSALVSSKAWGGELRDAPFWAALQSLNTLVTNSSHDANMGVISVDLDIPIFSWLPLPSQSQNHSILWFKVNNPIHQYGGLFLTALDSKEAPFFFPVDPDIKLRCSDIDEVVQSIDVLNPVNDFILTFCQHG